MSKNTRAVKEYTREQRLVNENKQLKRELMHLRKQISKLDGDRYETLRQMAADQETTEKFNENMGSLGSTTEDLKKEWACRNCEGGILEIVLYSKMGETFYLRKCDNCNKRTKGQRYTADVKGILGKS